MAQRTKADVLMEHYGTTDYNIVFRYIFKDHPLMPLKKMIQMKLPYYAPDCPKLPSVEAIMLATLDPKNSIKQEAGLMKVTRMGNLVIKFMRGSGILQEAENMLFLQKHSEVQVPKVYAVFRSSAIISGSTYDNVNFTIVEYIPGKTLSYEEYNTMDDHVRNLFLARLGEQIKKLRSPSLEQAYYGRVYHQAFCPVTKIVATHPDRMYGPYYSYEDFITALYRSAELSEANCTAGLEYEPRVVRWLSEFKPTLLQSHGQRPVLTHMDLKFQNIIAAPIQDQGQNIVDWKVTIIDWDFMAWLPAWGQIAAISYDFARVTGKLGVDPLPEDWDEPYRLIFPDWDEFQKEREFFRYLGPSYNFHV